MEENFDVLDENGVFINKIASREECHSKGFWHRAVVLFIINSKGQVLLQQRSNNKKIWPDLWDITAGGHVLEGEFGFEALIRETKEELDLDIDKNDLLHIGSTISSNNKSKMIDNHFNDYFVLNKEIDLIDIKLQEEEVQDIKWFEKNDIIEKIHNNYDTITDKIGCWEYLEKYLNRDDK